MLNLSSFGDLRDLGHLTISAAPISDSVKNMFRSVRRDGDLRALRPQRRNKFVLTVTVIAVNCALAVVFSVKRGGRGISRYLLFIFIANMGIYVVYYIVMKCYLR